jgi:hypothetical protein
MRKILRMIMFSKAFIWTLVFATFLFGWMPPESQAMLAPAELTSAEPIPNRAADMLRIQSVLEVKMIKQRLEDFGLTMDEINARLSKLSDAQVHEMATNLDALIPGGDGLGIIIALLVIAILVVILIYLLGHKITITK